MFLLVFGFVVGVSVSVIFIFSIYLFPIYSVFGERIMAPEGRSERESPHRGLLGFLVLVSLVEGEAHGYEVMRRIEEVTGGYWRPAPGSLYPVIDSLEKEGLIECVVKEVRGKARRVCRLTDDGWGALLDLLERKVEAYISILDHLFGALGKAIDVLDSDKARRILESSTRGLRRVCDKYRG